MNPLQGEFVTLEYQKRARTGRFPISSGSRLLVLELILVRGAQTVQSLLREIPQIGRVYTEREFTIRMRRWMEEFDAHGIRPPLRLGDDGHYDIWRD